MSFDFYLGSNSAGGFTSYFDSFTVEMEHVTILKGCPGCGKSTFLKKIAEIAEGAGLEVSRVWCSSDDSSLDAVYIPALRLFYADGTVPHALNPSLPGARDTLIDFGAFLDTSELEKRRGELENLNNSLAAEYGRAYSYLCAAGSLLHMQKSDALAMTDESRLIRRARRIITVNIPRRRGVPEGKIMNIFLNSLTPNGPVFLDNFDDYTVCELGDALGLHGVITGCVMDEAVANGFSVFAARDPLFPADAPLHLVIPELKFALCTSGRLFGCPDSGRRRVRLDSMADPEAYRENAARRKRDAPVVDSLISSACAQFARAKELHDEIEWTYNPYINFDGVAEMKERQYAVLRDRIARM